MKNWLTRLFPPPQTAPTAPAIEDGLTTQRELQSMRMELDGRDQKLRALQQELDRLRTQQEQLITETVNTRLDTLVTDLAGPASQILTQADLLENQGKPVDARDVLTVARRIVRALERHGVTFEGKIGEQVGFDPNRHTPLSTSNVPQTGQPVTIRFVGARYGGKIVYKSVVE